MTWLTFFLLVALLLVEGAGGPLRAMGDVDRDLDWSESLRGSSASGSGDQCSEKSDTEGNGLELM